MYNNPPPRRLFLRRLAAGVLLAALENVHADHVARNDERLETGYLEYGGLRCYVARPRHHPGKMPVVLVLHEERGLDRHIEDVARRAALSGFAAVAPDLLSPTGGTPSDERRARHMIAALDSDQTMANLLAIVEDLATRSRSVVAASAFYDAPPDAVDVAAHEAGAKGGRRPARRACLPGR